MSEEISLSLEETNKLRIKAGLSPIPTTSSQLNEEVREVISLSIEETNKLRQKLDYLYYLQQQQQQQIYQVIVLNIRIMKIMNGNDYKI